MDFGAVFALVVVVALVAAFIPATVAERKGQSGPLFFVFGLFAWPFAMAVAFLMEDKNAGRASPDDRAEKIQHWMLLRDQGAITEEQFQTEKTRILMAP
jgi:MFS-type transporter involved in bile tolerance (Atg22 family)